jgi:hypothetical protein
VPWRFWSRAGRREIAYLCAAQAYMLISMPTGTSTIFGVFQAIRELPSPRGTEVSGRILKYSRFRETAAGD